MGHYNFGHAIHAIAADVIAFRREGAGHEFDLDVSWAIRYRPRQEMVFLL